ncbi:50S ribosomal protein L30 [Nonlabens mediterrranea]|uniref:Large ribosomal subunit protein uL30 n=1 Tax=Nonlabens mediterrranea TaxID=1419947 RepID=A0ABS0A189_9FLAO|nr:50S ribosomal protein L30 [Nonlabens mediterrranea]
MMGKLKITKVRSAIKRPLRQKRTLEALGLRKMNQVVEHDDTPVIQGMIAKVEHLVSVEKA